MHSASRFLAAIRGFRRRHKSKIKITARNLRPIKQELPSLAQLPNEIISHIVELVGEVWPESLDDLCMVCSYFYDRASTVRHSQVTLRLYHQVAAHARLDLVSRSDCLSAIRTLRVIGGYNGHTTSSPVLLSIVDALPKMTGVRDIYWKDSIIPEQILEQLTHRQTLRLHVEMVTANMDHRYSQPPGALPSQVLLESLTGCLNLASIRVKVEYTNARQCLDTTVPLKPVLISCPHLSSLDLDISTPRTGCVRVGPLREYVGLGFHGGERPPPLEELRALYYPLGHRQNMGTPAFDYEGYPADEAEEDYWSNTFDWSRLRRLRDIPPQLARELAPKLTVLESLDLTVHWYRQGYVISDYTLSDFLSAVPGHLKSVHLPSPLAEAPSTALIGHHGTTLRSLSLTSPETWAGDFPSSVPSAAHLAAIRDGIPHLENLALDVRRAEQEDWPYDVLAAAATFSHLRRLELRFELGSQIKAPVRPYLTAAAAAHMAGYLEKHAGTALRHLRLLCGGPPYREDQDSFAGIGQPPGWSKHCSTGFECEVPSQHHLEQQRGSAPFRIRCEKLNRVLNERLWRAVRGDEKVSFPKMDALSRLNFKVALQGPLAGQEYEAWFQGNNK